METDDFGHHLLHHQPLPVLFPASTHHWPAASWTPETLTQLLHDQQLTFRIGSKQTKGVEWESQCAYRRATMSEFVEWESGQVVTPDHPLSGCHPTTHWAYCDYKHMAQIFTEQPHVLKAVGWSRFGFSGRDGEKSTFWLGSRGAHTQCHYDTYGCNLVAQIYGRKHWVLFPPSQTDCMYPTRIPYEESSVFSEVSVASPDIVSHPRFKMTAPMVVILEPGDVMFIPRHWWHDVTCVSTSISINSWIELPTDGEERLREAVTRCIVMATMDARPSIQDVSWLNPTEDVTDHEDNLEYLRKSLLEVNRSLPSQTIRHLEKFEDAPPARVSKEGESCQKKAKIEFKGEGGIYHHKSAKNDQGGGCGCGCPMKFKKHHLNNHRLIKQYSFEEYIKYLESEESEHETLYSRGNVGIELTPEQASSPLVGSKGPPLLSSGNVEQDPRSVAMHGAQSDKLSQSESTTQKDPSRGQKLESISNESLHLTLLECLTHPSVITKVNELLSEKLNK